MQINAPDSFADTISVTKPLRILVADDDPPSRLYLSEAIHQLGHQATSCEDGNAALSLAQQHSFDVLLLDYYMPGISTLELLHSLRQTRTARSCDSPAIATSAEVDKALELRLQQAGFTAVLNKPCSLKDLQQIISTVGKAAEPILDDTSALRVSGNLHVLHALRGLLREELMTLYQALDQLQQQPSQLDERLHRLRSSCGFCGAAQLAEQARLLQAYLHGNASSTGQAMTVFRQVLLNTIHALTPSAL
jgi:two-component system, OmpR family, response regulator